MASTTFQIGGAVGLALLIGVSSLVVPSDTMEAEAMTQGIRYAIAAAGLAALVGAILAVLLRLQPVSARTLPKT